MDVGDDLEALVNIGQIQGPRRGRRRNARPPDALVAIADPAAVEVAADAPMLPADPDDGLAALVAVGNVERVNEKFNQRSGLLVEKARNKKKFEDRSGNSKQPTSKMPSSSVRVLT